jgi:hypothetical protein
MRAGFPASIACRRLISNPLSVTVWAYRTPNAALRSLVGKAAELLENGIHLLVIDLQPPSRRDPNGRHGEIWQEIAGVDYVAPPEKPLTLAAYDAGDTVRAYVVNVAVGDALVDMPLFLAPRRSVSVPLDATYQAAFAAVPRRWLRVLEPGAARQE